MKSSHKKAGALAGTQQKLLHATPVALACALVALGGPAAAQQAAGQTITVTGIRGAIESAISAKKNSDSIVESINAEDIGKLPDSSIAESIARLPGVTAQRVNGRASEISIRGLSGDFSNTLLNGREQVSTGNNRSVEFDQYPSELLSSVLVYKTPDSALVGQGLSGTIDLQTVRPLSFGQRVVSLNVRGEKNGQGTPFEGDGNRLSFSYIDQFANRTVGVAFGAARLTQNVQKARQETYGTADSVTLPTVNGGNAFTFNNGFKYFVDETDETRTAMMGVIEIKPNKNFSSTLDLFYSKFDKEIVKRGLEIQVNDSWKGAGSPYYPDVLNPVFEGGRLVSGTWTNVNPLSRHIWEPRNDKLQSIGWNTKWKFADKWAANFDLSTSSAESVERVTEMEAGQYDVANNRPLPEQVTIANYSTVTGLQYDRGNLATMRLTDPESWGQNGYDKIISTDDKIKALRLSATRDLEGLISRVDFGVNRTERDKVKSSTEAFLRVIGRAGDNPGAPLPPGTTSLPLPGTGLTTIAFDPADALASYRFDANVNGDILRKGWTVNEKITTMFVKGDIGGELFGIPVRGNIGAQVVRSDQRSTAPVVDNANQAQYVVRTDGKSYTDVLPSVNLAFDLAGDQIVRAGIGRQMARPRMDQLSAFQRYEITNEQLWSGSGGNPNLDPFRATAYDISYEKYFGGNKGYVSVAGFYKDLESYIFDFTNTNYDFTGFPAVVGGNGQPISNIGKFTAPTNGTGGKIQGIELAASVPLGMFTPMLNGFGVVASYSNTSSAIKPFGDADTRPLPGLSKKVSTLTGYYENAGFQFRVASRYRSEFLAEIEGFGGDREYKYAGGERITDLQVGYEFQSGMAKGLNFLVQVNNLTNEPYTEYSAPGQDVSSRTKLDENGRTVLFGVSYKF
jgi:iron complex outermembrane recepter protein